MRRRVFIAINLPEKIKKRLVEYRERYNFLPVHWTKKDSLHLTLIFIGYATNEQVLELCRAVREIAEKVEPFMIRFKKILCAPSSFAVAVTETTAVKKATEGKPRMVWVEGEKSEELIDLKSQLEEALLNVDSGLSKKEYKPFTPHMTLARVNQTNKKLPEDFDWKSVEEPFNFQIPVASVEVMESDLRSDGAEYAVLESSPLGGIIE